MWKKDEARPGKPEQPRVGTPAAANKSGKATIGPSICIRGDVTGSEDLLIQGRVDGSVTLDLHAVTVGSEGRVNANIIGRVITIEGEVEGDLTALEQVVLLGSARVQGDIKAPRVVLEDGATFRGLVDMSASAESARVATAEAADHPGNGRSPAKAVIGAVDQRDAPSKSGGEDKDSSPRSGTARSTSAPKKRASGAVGPAGA